MRRRLHLLVVPALALSIAIGAPAELERLLDEAYTHLARGELDEALRSAEAAAKVDRSSAEAAFLAGVAAYRNGSVDDAEHWLKRSLKLRDDPPLEGTCLLLGMIERAHGNWGKALKWVERELERYPASSDAIAAWPELLVRAGREEEALEAYRAWQMTDPGAAAALVGRFQLGCRLLDLDAALETIPSMAAHPDVAMIDEVLACTRDHFFLDDRLHEGSLLIRAALERDGSPEALQALSVAADVAEVREPGPDLDTAWAYFDGGGSEPWTALAGGAIAGWYGPKTVSEGFDAVHVAEKVNPSYPELARVARLQAMVLFHAVIGRDGRLRSIRLLPNPAYRPNMGFDLAAREAVEQWVYEPVIREGEAVEVSYTVSVVFKLFFRDP